MAKKNVEHSNRLYNNVVDGFPEAIAEAIQAKNELRKAFGTNVSAQRVRDTVVNVTTSVKGAEVIAKALQEFDALVIALEKADLNVTGG